MLLSTCRSAERSFLAHQVPMRTCAILHQVGCLRRQVEKGILNLGVDGLRCSCRRNPHRNFPRIPIYLTGSEGRALGERRNSVYKIHKQAAQGRFLLLFPKIGS